MAVALEYERTDKLACRGNLTETQVREVLSDILKRVGTGEELRSPSIDTFMREWLENKDADCSAGTAERYTTIVESFLTHLRVRSKRPLTSLSARDIQGYITARQKEGLSAGSIRLVIGILHGCLRRAQRDGLIQNNPVEAIDPPDTKGQSRGTFTPQEVKMLVDVATGELRTLVLFGYFTGARLRDCAGMTWTSVNLAAGTLSFVQQKVGGDPLVIPLHPDLLAHLEALATSDVAQEYVMPGLAEMRVSGATGLSGLFRKLVRSSGIDAQTTKSPNGRMFSKRTFHSLRHSFTSALADAGVAPELRMKLTGHSSESIHQGYTHQQLATLRAAVEKLPGLAAK